MLVQRHNVEIEGLDNLVQKYQVWVSLEPRDKSVKIKLKIDWEGREWDREQDWAEKIRSLIGRKSMLEEKDDEGWLGDRRGRRMARMKIEVRFNHLAPRSVAVL